MEFKRKLPIPMEIKEMYPLSSASAKRKSERDEEMKAILRGESDKFILIIGPCSADNIDSVLEYTLRLSRLQEKVADRLFLIPRVYTNKPRTLADGYKGMLHQPNPDEAPDMLKGILGVRELHKSVLSKTGLTTADEMLYPENHRYLSDILSYVTIGARSVENQQHRLTASGLDIPVGMKNPTGGDLSVLLNSVTAAQHGHTFLYRGWEVQSKGNPYAHAVLRGYLRTDGCSVPNYHYDDLIDFCGKYSEKGLRNATVIVDTNHCNSGKDHLLQPLIALDVMKSRKRSESLRGMVKGLMIESYIEDGCQPIGGGVFGKSITDPCLGFEKSMSLVFEIADLV